MTLAQAQSPRNEVYVVDSGLSDLAALLSALPAGARIILLNPETDGVEHLAAALSTDTGIDALHLLTHGNVGSLQMGRVSLDAGSLERYRAILTGIGQRMSLDGDWLLYGCNVGSGAEGALFIEKLAAMLGVDVAASTNLTGAGATGADWTLEANFGTLEAIALEAEDYSGTLQSEAEPNDTRAGATPLALAALMTGNLRLGTDVDHFAFTLSSAGLLDITFDRDGAVPAGGYRISLEDAAGAALISFTDRSYSQDITLGIAAGGTYYLRVGSQGTNHTALPYGLTLNHVPGTPTGRETEPNNSRVNADVLTLGTPMTGHLSWSVSPAFETTLDVDYFRLEVAANTVLDIGLVRPALGSPSIIRVVLEDSDGQIVSSFSDVPSATPQRVGISAAGTYYFHLAYVYDSIYREDAYTLSVDTSATPLSGVETEPNNTRALADTLGSGAPMLGQLYSEADVDHYRIGASAAGLLRLEVEPFRSPGGSSVPLVVRLEDAAGNSLYAFQVGTTKIDLTLALNAGGDYYLRLYTTATIPQGLEALAWFYSYQDPYRLTATFTAGLAGLDETEPNNNRATADPLVAGRATEGRASGGEDEDFFIVPASGSGLLTVDFDQLDAAVAGHFNLTIEDSAGNVLSQRLSSPALAPWTTGIRQAGDYFVHVDPTAPAGALDYFSSLYRLTAGFSAGTVQSHETEPNNSREQASVLVLGAPMQGQLLSSSDVDHFVLQAGAGVLRLTLHRVDPATQGMHLVTVEDWVGNPVMSQWFDGLPRTFVVGALDQGTYHVRVNPVAPISATPDTYRLTASVVSGGLRMTEIEGGAIEGFLQGLPGMGVVAGNLSSGLDRDLYGIYVDAPGVLTLEFDRPASATGLVHIQVRDNDGVAVPGIPGGNLLGEFADPVNVSSFRIGLATAGTHYIEVFSDSSLTATGDYLLTLGFSTDTASDYETEPNNTVAAADPMTPGRPMVGMLSTYGETDWYSVTLAGAGTLTVDLAPPPGAWLPTTPPASVFQLYMQDASGEQLHSALYAGQPASALISQAGTYFVRVSSGSLQGFEGNYSLTPSFVPDTAGSIAPEPNNNRNASTALAAGITRTGQIANAADVDYFSLAVASAGLLQLNFSYLAPTGSAGFSVSLENATGDTVASWHRMDADQTLVAAIAQAGTYHVRVANWTLGTGLIYTLSGGLAGTSTAGHEVEDNNIRANANPLALGASLDAQIHHLDDVDYYAIDVPHAGILQVSRPGRMDVRLEDANGNILIAANRHMTFTDLTVKIDAAGTYFLRMADAAMDYTVSAHMLAQADPSLELESNGQRSSANPLALGQTLRGLVSSAADKDHFAITVTSPGLLNLEFNRPDGIQPGELRIDVLDASGVLLTSYTDTEDTASYTTAIGQAGTYYARIGIAYEYFNIFNTEAGPYALTATHVPGSVSAMESGPNETRALAKPVLAETPIQGQLSSVADVDYFSINVAQAGLIHMAFRLSGTLINSYVDVSLEDASGNLLGRFVGHDALSVAVTQAGTYFARVGSDPQYFAAEGHRRYDLTLSHSGGSTAGHETEPNNQLALADPIALGGSIRGQSATVGDIDHFSITTPGPGNVRLSNTRADTTDSSGHAIQVSDDTGHVLVVLTPGRFSGGPDRPGVLEFAVDRAGVYGIQLVPTHPGTLPYQLHASFSPGNSQPARLLGSVNAERIQGNARDEVIDGGGLEDTLEGGAGNDTLIGSNDRSDLLGGTGDDVYISPNGIDRIAELPNEGFDEIRTLGTRYSMANHVESLVLLASSGARGIGNTQDNTITGGAGDDTLEGGEGADRLVGGMGNDLYLVENANDTTFETADQGIDTVETALPWILAPHVDNLRLLTSSGGEGTGNAQANWMSVVGDSPTNRLAGLGGNDTLQGSYRNDTLLGGADDDSLSGNDANDVLDGGDGDDWLDGGQGHDVLNGGVGDDVLIGYEGNDTLDGGGGYDQMAGNAGDDTYFIRARSFQVQEDPQDTGGIDTAIVSASFVKLPAGIEDVMYADGALALPYWIDALVSDAGAGDNFARLVGDARAMQFAFAAAPPVGDPSHLSHGHPYAEFQANEKAFARTALAYVSSVVDLSFAEVADPTGINTIAMGTLTQLPVSYVTAPSAEATGSDVFLHLTADAGLASAEGDPYALVLMQALGAALGLHADVETVVPGSGVSELPAADLHPDWTLMGPAVLASSFHLSFRPLDIAALHYVYGPSRTARTGSDTYLIQATHSNFIWDGAGLDTISAAGLAQSATLFLEPGQWGYLGAKADTITGPGQVTVNFGTQIERLEGGLGSDYLSGNGLANLINGGEGNDTLIGGAGNDTLQGGAGFDIADFSAASAGVQAELWRNFALQDGNNGQDALASVEGLTGSARADLLAGDSGANQLRGGSGSDQVYGADGADTLSGDTGNDTLDGGPGTDVADYSRAPNAVRVELWRFGTTAGGDGDGGQDALWNIENIIGSAFDDRLEGDAGANTLTGGAGRDTLDGGDGFDQADYSAAGNGVTAELWRLWALNDGGGAMDLLIGIESLRGSAHADLLGGSAGSELLLGEGGNDGLYGAAGNDTLIGGSGKDTLDGGPGFDTVDYSAAPSAVTAELWRQYALQDGQGHQDALWNIEALIGSALADLLAGAGNNESFFGGAGDDGIYAAGGNDTLAGGAGRDTLDGGPGVDTADYSRATSGVTAELWRSWALNDGHGGQDALWNIETLIGSAQADLLAGAAGNESFSGGAGNDGIYAAGGNDTLAGGAGADTLDGGTGTDLADYGAATAGVTAELWRSLALHDGHGGTDALWNIEDLAGSAHADLLAGNNGDNRLSGLGGADQIYAAGGNDTLTGGLGSDTLNGGTGTDTFVFDAALGPGNLDVLQDFNTVDDTLLLAGSVFAALAAPGALVTGVLRSAAGATTAADANDHLIYNSTTGALYYDTDGNSAQPAVQFALLGTGLALTVTDFTIY